MAMVFKVEDFSETSVRFDQTRRCRFETDLKHISLYVGSFFLHLCCLWLLRHRLYTPDTDSNRVIRRVRVAGNHLLELSQCLEEFLVNYRLAEDARNLCITFPYWCYLSIQADGYGWRDDRPWNGGLPTAHALGSLRNCVTASTHAAPIVRLEYVCVCVYWAEQEVGLCQTWLDFEGLWILQNNFSNEKKKK
jgi:hypothetical protein